MTKFLVGLSAEQICENFNLNPEIVQQEVINLFQNISSILKMIAPNFEQLEPSLENLLALLSRIKQSFSDNSVILNDKCLIQFEYYLSESDCVNISLDNDSIIIKSAKEMIIPPFQSRNVEFSFLAFLPHLLKVVRHTDTNSSILLGNLVCPKIEFLGVLLLNWGDQGLSIKKDVLLITICLSEHKNDILMGCPRDEAHIEKYFGNYSDNQCIINAANIERTILSAV